RCPAMGNELGRLPGTVIATTGGEPSALAAKAATSSIPIVFAIGSDPVKHGLTASINRPGGNATGITSLTNEMEPKRLGLLREVGPHPDTIGFLLNPSFSQAESQVADMQQAARAMNLAITVSCRHGSRDRRGIRSYRPTARSCPRRRSQSIF